MASSDPAEIHHDARSRWPSVEWTLEAFRTHRGTHQPKYGLDHYLGGAAGHRVDEAWVVIENELGRSVREILRNKPIADLTPDDLWNDVLAKTMEDQPGREPLETVGRPPARIVVFNGRVKLRDYLLLIATRKGIQRHRKMKPRLAFDLASSEQGANQEAVLDTEKRGDPTEADVLANEEGLRRQKVLSRAFSQMDDVTKALIRLVYIEDMKQIDAAKILNLSPFHVNRVLKKAIKLLREADGTSDL